MRDWRQTSLRMLPRNARSCSVDGEQYRWMVSDGARLLLVEAAEAGGERLEVHLLRELEGWYWFPVSGLREPGPVSNRVITAVVRAALQRGWQAHHGQGSFRLEFESKN